MAPRPAPHIAIAGGGIAGLTAALALARRGLAVTVFEQAPDLAEIGAGLQVSPNAWRVLDGLGLGAAIMAASIAPEAIRIRSARGGRTVATVPLGATAEARWGAPYRVVHRADLQEIVATAAVAAGADLRLGARIEGFDPREDAVEVATEAGEAERFAALIGADGLWSTVRLRIAGEGAPRYSRKVAWRATMPADALPPGIAATETGLWLGRDAHLVHYAVRDGREINVVAVTTGDWREPGWSAPGDAERIAGHFADWPDAARAVVAAPGTWHCWALADRPPLERWGEGAVTLIGDAAHPMLPFLAQGAAIGIEDAHVLAANLAGSADIAGALRRYEARRRARAARVQKAARANGEIYHLGGLAAAARDTALSLMPAERLLARWDWLYGWRG